MPLTDSGRPKEWHFATTGTFWRSRRVAARGPPALLPGNVLPAAGQVEVLMRGDPVVLHLVRCETTVCCALALSLALVLALALALALALVLVLALGLAFALALALVSSRA